MPLTSLPLPSYMTGKNLATFGITPAVATPNTVVGSAPALTYGTLVDLAGIGTFKSWECTITQETTDIKPANYVVKNQVPIELGFDLTARDIQTHVGYSALAAAWGLGTHLRVISQNVNGAVNGNVFCAIGTNQSFGFGQNSGEHNATLRLGSAGVLPYWGTAAGLTI